MILEESEVVTVPRIQFHNSYKMKTLFSPEMLSWGEDIQL